MMNINEAFTVKIGKKRRVYLESTHSKQYHVNCSILRLPTNLQIVPVSNNNNKVIDSFIIIKMVMLRKEFYYFVVEANNKISTTITSDSNDAFLFILFVKMI